MSNKLDLLGVILCAELKSVKTILTSKIFGFIRSIFVVEFFV